MAEKQKFEKQERVELGTFEGDVEIKDCQYLVPQQGNTIVIGGTLRIDGDTTIEGSVKAYALEAKTRDRIIIEGDLEIETTAKVDKGSLEVHGSVKAKQIEADGSLSIDGNLNCGAAKGGGSLRVGGNAVAQRLMGGGSVKVEGDAKAERINAGGSVKIGGMIDTDELRVGGSGKCTTGRIGKVEIGGSFKATGAIEVDEIDVGGSAVVGPGSKVADVDVGGAFKSTGGIAFGTIDVGGAVKLGGDSKGAFVDVGGALKVEGSLESVDGFDVGGKAVIQGKLMSSDTIKVGGTLIVDDEIETYRIAVGGRVEAKRINASDGFRIGKRGEVKGPVRSREILVRERARTDDLYGEDIRIEERARVGSVYGKDVYIERDAIVEGELLYTNSLDVEEGAKLRKESKKVDQLPDADDVLE